MRIQPARRLRGRLRLPGDKSISHRAAIIAALANGRTHIENFSTSEDCAATLSCLAQLGVSIERDGASLLIEGVGLKGLRAPSAPLDCGNSGTTMRLLAGVLAAQGFAAVLTGDESLRSRPMRRIIEPLELMGARISSEGGRAPLKLKGTRPLKALSYRMKVASAQVKSCILLAGVNAAGRTEVIEEAVSTRDHTERLLRWFGVPVETKIEAGANSQAVFIENVSRLRARDLKIPGDISSAAFLMVAAAALRGSDLEINSLGLNPTRTEIIKTLQELGADVRVREDGERCNEPIGDVHVHGLESLKALRGAAGANILRGGAVARLIDELPALAVLGTQVWGGLEIRDAQELRVKETDRIRAMVENLRAMGAEVKEYEDGLAVTGQTALRGARLDSYGDHRIAMAFTVAALLAEGESEIIGAESARVSFPEFYELLESVIER
ncbi:MAG: 3-phosphoshikimate 1-carboxyvinyltransferase [Pyrinomonadaceae bacterium]|nr:3-phosphoshikimate 1-carboxyvinyltransferase [Pyrinomonadaceae bacterium]